MVKTLLVLAALILLLIGAVQWRAAARERHAAETYPPQGRLIEVDGVTVHAEVFGNGPDLVLIHGASGSTRDMTFSLAGILADRYRVIVLDRPGLGWTERPDGFGGAWNTAAESPRQQARLLARAVDELGGVKPLIVGHSFGGAVAMAWALERTDLAGIVMLGAVSHPWPGDLYWQYPVNASALGGALFVPLLSAFAPEPYVDRIVASIFSPQPAPKGYVDHVGTALTLRRATLRANARQVNSLRPHVVEMHDHYPNLTLPIEIVHGDADTIVPLEIHSTPLAERVASAALTVLPGIGHMPHHVAQPEVIAAIDRAAARAGLR